ncbi:hypothetical protein [Algivirga pacifica]|uniref:Uncharacterized protein n=1 Tax=Algivirga pacifica TaxID=1162670 RepID=A0ABP9DC45_9BACT
MSITIKNYFTKQKEIDFSNLPPALQKANKEMDTLVNAYDKSPAIKRVIDLYLEKLNKAVGQKEKPKPAPKPKSNTKTKKTTSTTTKSTTKAKTTTTKKLPAATSHFTEDIRLLRRFKALIGKEKTRKQLLGVFQDMERRMVEQKVRKDAKYAALLEQAHQLLAKMLKSTKEGELVNVEIKSKAGKDFFEKVIHAANESRVRASVTLLKSFIGLEGSINPDKAKVERLLNRLNTALEKEKVTTKDLFYKEIKEAKAALTQYLKAKESMIPISPMALNGIHCACGMPKK